MIDRGGARSILECVPHTFLKNFKKRFSDGARKKFGLAESTLEDILGVVSNDRAIRNYQELRM